MSKKSIDMRQKRRLVLIDWIKAVCVVLVILTHSDFMNDAMLDKTGLFYLLCVNKAVPCFMFLSGYVFALGAKNTALNEQYSLKKLVPKLMRLTVPTILYYAAYVVIMALSGKAMTLGEVAECFVMGDFGRGSYYYAVMVQFTLIAPLVYEIIKKYAQLGVAVIGAANLLYEIVWTMGDFSDRIYRICALRYLLVIAFGMYLSVKKAANIRPRYVTLMGVLGLCYILLPYFTGYEYKIFTVEPWNRSGMMSAFYVMAVMYAVFYFFSDVQETGFTGRAVSRVGQASYHIMYTQMLYFVIRPAFDQRVFDMTLLPIGCQYAMDIVVSVVLGLVFCVADNKIMGKFYKTK